MPLRPRMYRSPWMTSTFIYSCAAERDVYGAVVYDEQVELPCNVYKSQYEAMDAPGSIRVMRDSVTIQAMPQDFFKVGDQVLVDGERYSIIMMNPTKDHRNEPGYVTLTGVKKRGGV